MKFDLFFVHPRKKKNYTIFYNLNRPYGSSERSLKVPETKDPYVINGFVLSPDEGLILVEDVVMVNNVVLNTLKIF